MSRYEQTTRALASSHHARRIIFQTLLSLPITWSLLAFFHATLYSALKTHSSSRLFLVTSSSIYDYVLYLGTYQSEGTIGDSFHHCHRMPMDSGTSGQPPKAFVTTASSYCPLSPLLREHRWSVSVDNTLKIKQKSELSYNERLLEGCLTISRPMCVHF